MGSRTEQSKLKWQSSDFNWHSLSFWQFWMSDIDIWTLPRLLKHWQLKFQDSLATQQSTCDCDFQWFIIAMQSEKFLLFQSSYSVADREWRSQGTARRKIRLLPSAEMIHQIWSGEIIDGIIFFVIDWDSGEFPLKTIRFNWLVMINAKG